MIWADRVDPNEIAYVQDPAVLHEGLCAGLTPPQRPLPEPPMMIPPSFVSMPLSIFRSRYPVKARRSADSIRAPLIPSRSPILLSHCKHPPQEHLDPRPDSRRAALAIPCHVQDANLVSHKPFCNFGRPYRAIGRNDEMRFAEDPTGRAGAGAAWRWDHPATESRRKRGRYAGSAPSNWPWQSREPRRAAQTLAEALLLS